jgi:hypothetical protein
MERYRLRSALLAVGLGFQIPFCFAQKVIFVGPPELNVLKVVAFTLSKSDDLSFSLDRLDGYKIVLERDDIKFLSSPIVVVGDLGACAFANIPQGEYRLRLDVLRLSTQLKIHVAPEGKLFFDIKIGGGITIQERTAHEK